MSKNTHHQQALKDVESTLKRRPAEQSSGVYDLPLPSELLLGRLPSNNTSRPLRQEAVLQMQQQFGNAYVMRVLAKNGTHSQPRSAPFPTPIQFDSRHALHKSTDPDDRPRSKTFHPSLSAQRASIIQRECNCRKEHEDLQQNTTGSLPSIQRTCNCGEEREAIEQNAGGRLAVVQRQAPVISGPSLTGPVIASQIACLRGLFDEMGRQTWWYLRTACRDGNYLTSRAGVRYIPEDRADAFGHCWIGCQGAMTCGQDATRAFGEAYEAFREAMRILTLGFWGHNSYEEDRFNQRHGRELARNNPDGDCSSLCYQAIVSDALRFHGHSTSDDSSRPKVYNCSDITLNGQLYARGWKNIPFEHLERF